MEHEDDDDSWLKPGYTRVPVPKPSLWERIQDFVKRVIGG